LTKLPEDIKCVSYPTSCVGSQNFTSNFSTQAIFGMVRLLLFTWRCASTIQRTMRRTCLVNTVALDHLNLI